MSHLAMPVIHLYDLTQCALIVPAPTGIIYQQQAGGTGCLQPQQEGYLIPISNDNALSAPSTSLEARLMSLFAEGGGHRTLSKDLLEEMQGVLDDSGFTKGIRVNSDRADESLEAWVHVLIPVDFQECTTSPSLTPAILTWSNRD
ncbi:DUF6210 family protein [Chitinimonas naiadis]